MIQSLAISAIKSTVLPQSNEAGPVTAAGRSYNHWSEKLTIASAAFGTACAVVGFMLKNTIFGVFGVLLGLSNGIAAFFLHKFLPLKALEGHVQDLTGQVDRVDDQLERLKASNKQLQDFKDQFGPMMEEAQKAQAVMEKRLEDKTAAWEKAVKDFQESENKLDGVSQVLTKVQGVNSTLNSQIATLEADNKVFQENVEKLNGQVSQLQEIEKGYAVENARLEKTNTAMTQQSKELQNQFSALQGEMGNLQVTADKLTQERTALEKQVTALQTSLETANQATDKAAKEAASYAQAAKALEEASKQIQQRTDALKKEQKEHPATSNLNDLLNDVLTKKK